MNADVKFSWLFNGADRALRPTWDQILWETRNFGVLPSLGSLLPGWLLIVPKRPIANLSKLRESENFELQEVIADAAKRLAEFPGDVQFFEHGSSVGSAMSCGVDQAHLHIVPLEFDLAECAKRESEFTWYPQKRSDNLWNKIEPDREYLFVSGIEQSIVSYPCEPTSQWFRRLIADKIHKPECWNYREFPNLDIIEKTRAKLVA